MKVAITGANGFVGQNLHRYLNSRNIQVLSLSRPKFDLYRVDENSRLLQGVDVLIHCAACVHQMKNTKKTQAQFKHVNVYGTQTLLKAAKQAGVKQIIFLSTIKVNGEKTQNNAFSERDEPNPQDYYAQSKWQAEKLIEASGLPYTIIRPPLIVGPGMKGNMPRLINLVKKPVILPFGSIYNQRSFLHVFNLCTFIEKALLNAHACNQVFTLSDDAVYSTPALIRKLKQQVAGAAKIIPFPLGILKFCSKLLGKGEWLDRLTDSLVIDNSKAKQALHWSPNQNVW